VTGLLGIPFCPIRAQTKTRQRERTAIVAKGACYTVTLLRDQLRKGEERTEAGRKKRVEGNMRVIQRGEGVNEPLTQMQTAGM